MSKKAAFLLCLAASLGDSSASSYDPHFDFTYSVELDLSSDVEEIGDGPYEPSAFFEETLRPEIESEVVFSDDEVGCFVMRETDLRSDTFSNKRFLLEDLDVDSDEDDDDDDDGSNSMLSNASIRQREGDFEIHYDDSVSSMPTTDDYTGPHQPVTSTSSSTRRAFARPGWVHARH